MSAVPQQLLSLPKVKGISSIDNRVHRIFPTNASGSTAFEYSGLNRIIFSMPAYKSGFYNPQRSFIHFEGKTGDSDTYFNAGIPVFNRMIIRTGNGQVIEDISNVSTLSRLLSNFEADDRKRGTEDIVGDYRSSNTALTDTNTLATDHNSGRTFSTDLLSGLLGKAQQHYIPVGLFNASGGFSFEIELHLEDPKIACSSTSTSATSISYSLTNVSLQMEVVTLPSTVTDRLNSELQSDNKVSIPFATYRLHQAHFPQNSTSVDVNISESAHDLEAVYTVLRKQAYDIHTTGEYKSDNLNFIGGNNQSSNILKSYQFRYDTKYMPDAKAEMNANDNKLALLNALHTLDLAGKSVYASNKGYWDTKGLCCIVQSFKTSRDDFNNSLNSSSTGAPLELQIALKSAASIPMRIETFVKSNYTLSIMKGGMTTLLNGNVKAA